VTLFVDTSAFFAGAHRADTDHNRAARILTSGEELLTSDHVLVETWLLLNARLGQYKADEWWSGIRAGASAIESVGPADLEAAWFIGQAFPDQGFSLIDRTSFAVMQRLGIERVASFDHHFAVYRYGPDRRRAFQVIN
jgi:predicted nucleic acid-binding protein